MNRDFSLLDANVARVKEGLRVLEDVVRFVFSDQELWAALKILRHSLTQIEGWFGSGHLIRSRFGKDVGAPEITPQGSRCGSLYEIIRANASRVTEALRTLEEFAKLYTREQVFLIERARYQVYAVERDLLVRTPHFYLHQYFEQGIVCPISDSLDDLKDYVEAGARVIQLRDKKASKELLTQKAKEMGRFLRKKYSEGKDKVIFILNDHPNIAAKLPVDGVHIGQEDGQVAQVRILLGSNKIIGRSTHSLEQARAAWLEGADYIGVGPIFSTPSKPDREAIGFDILEKITKEIQLPFCAIGGIDTENVSEVYKRGAKNIAVIRSARKFFGLN